MNKFEVCPGQGPVGRKDGGGEWDYGPFLEGALYSCNLLDTEVGRILAKQWIATGKIKMI